MYIIIKIIFTESVTYAFDANLIYHEKNVCFNVRNVLFL